MGWPTITTEIAFTTNPGDVPVWVDVSTYVRPGLAVRRGRQNVLDRFEAGTFDLLLSNRDRRFEPAFAAGAYYPNVVPMRKIRLSAVWSGTTYYLFTGYILTWPPAYPGRNDAAVNVQAVDGFRVLNLLKLSATYSQELSSTRVTNVLDSCSWAAADRNISTGQTTVQAATLTNEKALQHLQDVAYSETGRLFMDGQGRLTFQDRHTPLKAPYDTSQGTFGDGAGELPYSDIKLSYDDTEIWNEVNITRSGGAAQSATDATSTAAYFVRTLERSDLLMTTDNEAGDMANYLLARYKDPFLRVPEITIKPGRDNDLWQHALGREIGDRITVTRRPPGGGAAISQDVLIERIEHDIGTKGNWTTRWGLTPANTSAYWILDSLTNSLLDSTTRLAYAFVAGLLSAHLTANAMSMLSRVAHL